MSLFKTTALSFLLIVTAQAQANDTYDFYINESGKRHGIDPAFIKSIMAAESSYNSRAVSHAGAQGLMQLMPATARRFGVRDVFNPQENIEGSVKYLAWLKNRFNGDVSLVLAGYNAGEGNVDKYGGIPPFKETQNYVVKVLGRYDQLYRQLGSGSVGSSAYSANTYKVISPSSTSNNRLIVSSSGRNSGVRASTISSSGGNSSAYTKSAFNSLR